MKNDLFVNCLYLKVQNLFLVDFQVECKFRNYLIKTFCNLNDKYGSPKLYDYGFGLVSPSSLRYILHAHLILSHIKSIQDKDSIDIVEIGGGYGGQYIILQSLFKKYNISVEKYIFVFLKFKKNSLIL